MISLNLKPNTFINNSAIHSKNKDTRLISFSGINKINGTERLQEQLSRFSLNPLKNMVTRILKLLKSNKVGSSQILEIETNKLLPINFERTGSGFTAFTDKTVGCIADLSPRDDSLYLDGLASFHNRKYKGIGTKLIQLAVEESIRRGYEGRVKLESVYAALAFYYKCGFRPLGENADKLSQQLESIIAAAKKSGIKPDTKGLPSVEMHIPDEQLIKIKEQIKKSPIMQD
ncbi:MAG: hypothetical protein A2Y25_07810 [Candidatus Melainabacteria bacterium GWF2_37_15]|nr:MAG: hypothetical protein A2Y25_07810 [Candidatus Melainabacteria bacterium GWF2_37_15]